MDWKFGIKHLEAHFGHEFVYVVVGFCLLCLMISLGMCPGSHTQESAVVGRCWDGMGWDGLREEVRGKGGKGKKKGGGEGGRKDKGREGKSISLYILPPPDRPHLRHVLVNFY